MRWLRIIRLRVRSLWSRAAVEQELDEELRFHFDQQVAQNIAAGMDPAEARYAAAREFGNFALHKDECRETRKTNFIESVLDDARHAFRNLCRDPYLALTATLTLAVCIGATTSVFSVANSILIRPLPYPNSNRIDWISERVRMGNIAAAPDYFALRERNRIFEEVAAYIPNTANWTGVERPAQLDTANVSASFFRVMGSRPLLGRYFTSDEEGPKAPAIVLLSYDFWRNRLGSDPQILGKTIALDRLPHTIIGVMPQGFDFPRGIQLWLPLTLDRATQSFPLSPSKPIAIVSILARRKPDVTPQQTMTEMQRLTLLIRSLYPQEFRTTVFRTDTTIGATPLQDTLTGKLRPAILILAVAVSLVLLIACVNIANLLLARAGSRQREVAVRMALGSGRARIIRQMLTESLVLAIPGGLAGVGLAAIGIALLNRVKPGILVQYPAISIDWRVLAFTLGLTLATGVLFGILPALSAAGIRIQDALKSAGLTQSAGRRASSLRKCLTVAELSISLVLLLGAGLLARSFLYLAHTELGFVSDHLLTFRLTPVGGFSLDRNYGPFFTQILSGVQRVPTVRSAALVADIPLGDAATYQSGAIRVVGRAVLPLVSRPVIGNTLVSPDFFSTMRIALKSGRLFDTHDSIRPPDSAKLFVRSEPIVVNEALVHQIFPHEDPLGRPLAYGLDRNGVVWNIIGVVGNVRSEEIGLDPPPLIYRCTCSGVPMFRAAYVVRTTLPPKTLVPAIEKAVRAVDRDQPIYDVKTMDERRDAALAPERFQLMMLGAFAAIAILLAAAGIYGTMSYLVMRRTREIGIRMAMGARSGDLLRMVLGETTMLVLAAIAVGLGGAWALTRFIRSMLYGIGPLDPPTFVVTAIALTVVVLIAAWGPVNRAAHVDPITALRDE